MSSTTFKNSGPQRKYRERGQLAKREHLGLLEKHKDYKLRAVNYQRKQNQLQRLRLKAALKNKDEFNFKMIKGKQQDGAHIQIDSDDEQDSEFDPQEYKKIVKTYNQNLLKVQYHRNENKVNKLQEQLQLLSAPKQNKHTFFVNNVDEVEQFDLVKKYNTVPEMLSQTHNILTKDQLQNLDLNISNEDIIQSNKQLKTKYQELSEAMLQKERMKKYFLKLDTEKGLLTKQKKKIKKHKNGKIYRFVFERKK